MSQQIASKEKALQSSTPQFSHDPGFIIFRSWTTILSLKGLSPEESRANESFLFLNEDAKGCDTERLPVRGPVCLRNTTQFAHLNVAIVCGRTGERIFFAQELPAGRFLHLEFLQEGSYTLHYSPAFSSVTLRRNIQTFKPAASSESVPHNFHPSLQQRHAKLNFNSPFSHKLQTPRAKLTFNFPFSGHKG